MSGSLGGQSAIGNASTFYEGVPLFEVDNTDASEGYLRASEPMSSQVELPLSRS